VEGLVQQSLLRVEPDAAADPRLGMLETIREYAQGQLSVSGEATLLRRRHALYFSTLAGRAAPYLFQAEQAHWLARLEADHDNLRGALQWAIEHDPEVGLRLAGALWWFWWSHGHLGEGRRWLEVVLDRGRGLAAVFRVPAVHAAGAIALHQGDYGAARAWLEEGLALFRNLGDPSGVAMSLTHLGTLAEHQDDDERAIALFVESLALYRALQDGRGTAFVLNRLGEVARARGDHRRARELYTESLTLRREQEDKGAVVWSLHNLGYIALNEHDPATGCALFTEALTISRALEEPWAIALCLAGLAASTDAAASPERAGTLYGASEALREACGARLWPADRADYERGLAACRRRAEAASFEASWAGGRSLSLKQAVAYALGG
jgi:non-specific serine/threonine protein kinase